MAAPLALIEEGHHDGSRIIALRGEIDVGSTAALRDWLTRATGGGRSSVAVDFRHVDFMAVSGLYVLCDEQQRMVPHRARLTVVCDNPRILQLFSVCRVSDVLPIVATRDNVPADDWTAVDDARAARLTEWLARYASAG
jgi:anti-sigma B factor antagonist